MVRAEASSDRYRRGDRAVLEAVPGQRTANSAAVRPGCAGRQVGAQKPALAPPESSQLFGRDILVRQQAVGLRDKGNRTARL